MDYNLAGLSTRSFEQLIQAIAAKIIGPGLIVFGDGPDGGREATFEGTIPFPNEKTEWHGYCVIQAKFKQRSEGTTKDGAWALNQLRAELKKFADSKKNLRKPEYYIFVTNVVLTPAYKKGGKDKAAALIKEYKDRLSINDFRIWDYDQIGVFLDGSEDIRHAYAAWITPGDVLARVIEHFMPKRNFEEIMTQFLQRELIADQYSRLEQAGHSAEERTSLAEVFVDLPISDRSQGEPPDEQEDTEKQLPGFINEVLSLGNNRLDPQTIQTSKAASIAIEKKHRIEPGRLVLVGGPGQGKSTITQFLCQLYRAALLKEKPPQMMTIEARNALELISSQCRSESLDFPCARRFPIMVKLNQFASDLSSAESRTTSLFSYILLHIKKCTDRDISAEDLRSWLVAYPWLLVLDGLDEVPSSSNRDEVLQAVQDFLVQATTSNADLLLVATTRPQGYNDDFSPHYYRHKSLVPLSVPRAMHYADRLAHVRYGNDSERVNRVIARLKQASAEKTTARLMRSPLQITIMTTLVDRIGQPPQERWRLFKEYYNVICQREMERDIPAASLLRNHRPDIDAIHQRVALALQVDSEHSGRTEALLPHDQFAVLVENRLKEEGHEDSELQELKNRIISTALERLVFLVAPESEAVGFEIRSLQEFMAAECLMDGTDDLVQKRLGIIAPASHWRNTFLFAAGKCFADRQHLRDTIYTICANLNEVPASAELHTAIDQAILSGARLALDLLEDGSARRQPKYSKLLTRLALRLVDMPPDKDHNRLAEQYRSDLAGVYREELTKRLNSATLEHALGAWAVVIQLIGKKNDWAEELGQRYWPEKPDKKLQILKAAWDLNGGEWLLNKWIDIIPHTSPADFNLLRSHQPRVFSINSKTDWFKGFNDFISGYREFHHSTIEIHQSLTESKARKFCFPLLSIEHKIPYVLEKIPNISTEWSSLLAVEKFNRDPSANTLANTLRGISNSALQNLSSFHTSWPLGACLSACQRNGMALEELASQAADGNLGDLPEWEAAEKRWQERGVTRGDLEYMSDTHWPYDQRIAEIGYPFAIGGISYTHSPHLLTITKEIYTIYVGLKSGRVKKQVADWLMFLLDICGEQGTRISDFGSEELVNIVNISKYPYFNLGILNALSKFDWQDQNFVRFLDSIGRKEHKSIRFFYKSGFKNDKVAYDFAPMLDRLYQASPKLNGVLRLLATVCVAGYHPSDSFSYPPPMKYTEPRFQKAAILLRLAQGDWTTDEALELGPLMVHATTELEQTEHRHPFLPENDLNDVFHLLDNHHLKGPHVDVFLLTILDKLQDHKWRVKASTIREIINSQRRRLSGLGTKETWEATELPKKLLGLCRDESRL